MVIVRAHREPAGRTLIGAVLAGVRTPPRPEDARMLTAGGEWANRQWREALRQEHQRARPLLVVGMRCLPTDQLMTDTVWSDISRLLATQAGLDEGSWVAVRTGMRTAVLIAPTDRQLGPRQASEMTRAATRVQQQAHRASRPAPLSMTPSPQPRRPASEVQGGPVSEQDRPNLAARLAFPRPNRPDRPDGPVVQPDSAPPAGPGQRQGPHR